MNSGRILSASRILLILCVLLALLYTTLTFTYLHLWGNSDQGLSFLPQRLSMKTRFFIRVDLFSIACSPLYLQTQTENLTNGHRYRSCWDPIRTLQLEFIAMTTKQWTWRSLLLQAQTCKAVQQPFHLHSHTLHRLPVSVCRNAWSFKGKTLIKLCIIFYALYFIHYLGDTIAAEARSTLGTSGKRLKLRKQYRARLTSTPHAITTVVTRAPL